MDTVQEIVTGAAFDHSSFDLLFVSHSQEFLFYGTHTCDPSVTLN